MKKKKFTLVLMALFLGGAAAAWSGTTDLSHVRFSGEAPGHAPDSGPVSDLSARGYNVLLVVTDQQRHFEALPMGTNWRAQKLLQSIGTTFEKHYISSNMSTSSRSVMYTGRHITQTKMPDNACFPWQAGLDTGIPTIGTLMRQAGYHTAYKGKFFMLGESAAKASGEGANKNQQNALETYGFSDWNFEGDIEGGMLEGYHKDAYIKGSAIRWLRDRGASLDKSGKPFFLAVNFVNPHDIMFYNPGSSASAGSLTVPPKNTLYSKKHNYLPRAWEHESDMPAHREFRDGQAAVMGALPRDRKGVLQINDFYLNSIQDVDDNLMGLLDELKRLGMMDSTIVIFTSDHGEMGGSHRLKGKGPFIYENNLRVPFIIVHPAYKGIRRISTVTSHLDLVPTILDMAGLSADEKSGLKKGLAGHSLMPLIEGKTESVRDGALYAYSAFSTLDSAFRADTPAVRGPDLNKRGLLRAIVTERYKFARYFSPLDFNMPLTLEELYARNDVELYDLKTDPHELVNLAADPSGQAELILKMNDRLNELIRREIGVDRGDEISAALKFFGAKK